MASILDLREGLAARLSTINGLRVSEFQPDAIRPPVAFVLPDNVQYDLNANRGADTFTFIITLIVSRADDRSGQKRLDGFIVGPTSVKTAVEADRTLGGKADTCRVTEMRNYTQIAYGDQTFLSAEFEVEVVA